MTKQEKIIKNLIARTETLGGNTSALTTSTAASS